MSTSYGRYVVDTCLGRGSMGVVWRGRDPLLDRTVAVKVLSPLVDLPGELRGQYEERFLREARAAARLAHPQVVAVYDMGVHDDCPYLVMEHVEGTGLDKVLKARGPLEPPLVARLGEQLCSALACAHEQGIVHRDVKPSNALLAADGGVKLMDFGIARLGSSKLTVQGQFLGSPRFSSPEQIQGDPLDARSDLFSLGVTLFLVLTGQHPFAPSSLADTVKAIVEQPAPAPSSLRPGIGPQWDGFFARALAKPPGERFQTAAEMAEALAALEGPAVAPPVAAAGVPEPLDVVVEDGPDAGRRVALVTTLEIGRSGGDLLLSDPTVSGRHCRVERTGDRVQVVDLGGRNGTWLEGQRVTRADWPVGVTLGLGAASRLRLERRAAARPAPITTVLDEVRPGTGRQPLRPLAGTARLVLVVREGPAAGARFPVDHALVLGRDEGDVRLNDPRVSRKHAMVERRSSTRAVLRDLASANGTYLGTERLVREVEIKQGDLIRLGSTVIAVEAEGS